MEDEGYQQQQYSQSRRLFTRSECYGISKVVDSLDEDASLISFALSAYVLGLTCGSKGASTYSLGNLHQRRLQHSQREKFRISLSYLPNYVALQPDLDL